MTCPDENQLSAYAEGGLGGHRRLAVETHIAHCAACRVLVSGLAQDDHVSATEMPTVRDIPPNARTKLARGGARSTTTHVVAGTMIGEYEVTSPLGSGGMGTVYSAVHPRIGKQVAIKILQHEHARDAIVLARFENEARAVNAIRHPNLVDIFAFGELPDGRPYFVMELVDGESLGRWLKRSAPVPPSQLAPILRQICDAVGAAHERGIVHRDLKPGNIMIAETTTGPRIKILDFGVAKVVRERESSELTNPGVAIGTPYFMSPEQLLGEVVDQRTDVYALGVLVYLALCNEYPFSAETPSEVGDQHLLDTPAPPSTVNSHLPRSLDAVVTKALAKRADERFPSVRDLADAFEACLVPAAKPLARRRRWIVPVVAATCAAVGFGVLYATHSSPVTPSAQAPAITMPIVEPHPAAVAAPETAVPREEPAPTPPPQVTRPPAKKRAQRPPIVEKHSKPVDDKMLFQAGSLKKVP